MPLTDFNSAWGAGPKSAAAMIQALEKRGIYVIQDAENPTALTPGNVTYLAFNSIIFKYDATDTTTAHDGVTCIVTSDGKRFKSFNYNGVQSRIKPVVSRTLTAPPGSPALGASYIVATGATGAWAGKDKFFADWTARGWMFIAPNTYDMALVVAETLFYHYNAAGNWVAGIPAITIGANSIPPSALKYGRFGLAIVNRTTNTPPSTPSDGDAYIIGPSPTGAWAGLSGRLAIYESSAFTIYTPYKGATCYDTTANISLVFDGSNWISSAVGLAQAIAGNINNTSPLAISSSPTNYAYSDGVAPSTSVLTLIDQINFTAKKTGARVEVDLQIRGGAVLLSSASAADVFSRSVYAMALDTEGTARDWCSGPTLHAPTASGYETSSAGMVRFQFAAPDTALHTIKVFGTSRISSSTSGIISSMSVSRTQIYVREAA